MSVIKNAFDLIESKINTFITTNNLILSYSMDDLKRGYLVLERGRRLPIYTNIESSNYLQPDFQLEFGIMTILNENVFNITTGRQKGWDAETSLITAINSLLHSRLNSTKISNVRIEFSEVLTDSDKGMIQVSIVFILQLN